MVLCLYAFHNYTFKTVNKLTNRFASYSSYLPAKRPTGPRGFDTSDLLWGGGCSGVGVAQLSRPYFVWLPNFFGGSRDVRRVEYQYVYVAPQPRLEAVDLQATRRSPRFSRDTDASICRYIFFQSLYYPQ